MAEKIEPCSKCGGERSYLMMGEADGVERRRICCLDCGHVGPVQATIEQAVAAWNGEPRKAKP